MRTNVPTSTLTHQFEENSGGNKAVRLGGKLSHRNGINVLAPESRQGTHDLIFRPFLAEITNPC